MILTRVFELLYPPCCVSCASRLPAPAFLDLCVPCAREVHAIPPPLCPRCGRHSAISLRAGEACANCHAEPPAFARAVAAFQYSGPVRDAIHRIKFESHARLARDWGARLGELAPRMLPHREYDVIMPVPLHPWRQHDRGFNQAALLAQHVSRALATPVALRTLVRSRLTRPQSALEPSERAANVRAAFRVQHPERVDGRRVLLVDDVLTTGATANACTAALLGAGAREVDVLVLASN